MIALDLDGTLLDYSPEGPTPRINHALMARLAVRGVREVAILTNQGGLCFGVLGYKRKDGKPYPTPAQFYMRLAIARNALAMHGIAVSAVRVSCWHKAAAQPEIAAAVQLAARQVRECLAKHRVQFHSDVDWTLYTTARARKPQPLMLHSVGATEYWGDSDEDEGAARAAGVPFVHVDRFFGEV